MYPLITDLSVLQKYLAGAALVSFDFETGWRHESKPRLIRTRPTSWGLSRKIFGLQSCARGVILILLSTI